MPDSKITALASTGTGTDPANDPLVIVDVSDTSMAATGTTKKVTLNNLLACSPTATLASATITGDLTVDTSTLKVDSTNNRVGIGTATPTAGIKLDIVSTTSDNFVRFTDSVNATGYLGVQASNSTVYLHGNNNRVSLSCSTSNTTPTEQLRITAPGVFEFLDGAGGTRMTLNSTGLGVGGSPTEKLSVNGSIGFQNGGTQRWHISASSGSDLVFTRSAVADRFTITADGNVGVGVTPSAWQSGYKAIEMPGIGILGANGSADLYCNAYLNSSFQSIYRTTAAATNYAMGGGFYRWFIAPSGTAGNAITWTQAMTLDTSGNLLVGKTTSLFSTVGVEASQTGFFGLTNSASTNASTNLSLYSTGAAAFRFYVGLGGTVFATNTTISAISDARFKENVQDIDVGLGAILALKPRKFDWKAGKGKDIKGDRGFIAQEFEQVFPQLVDEWKDNAPEGEAPYKSVRQDLIPVLVKAIQELAAEVNALKNA